MEKSRRQNRYIIESDSEETESEDDMRQVEVITSSKRNKRCPNGSRMHRRLKQCVPNKTRKSDADAKSSFEEFHIISKSNCLRKVKVNMLDGAPASREMYDLKKSKWGSKVGCRKACYKKLMDGKKQHMKHIMMESQQPEMMDELGEMM